MRQAILGQKGWPQAWRSPEPKPQYEAVNIGGEGHGLATAYYLAKEHGLRNIAVLEKGWIGGGNTGRNTTNVWSDYMFLKRVTLYDFSLKLYEKLGRNLPNHREGRDRSDRNARSDAQGWVEVGFDWSRPGLHP